MNGCILYTLYRMSTVCFPQFETIWKTQDDETGQKSKTLSFHVTLNWFLPTFSLMLVYHCRVFHYTSYFTLLQIFSNKKIYLLWKWTTINVCWYCNRIMCFLHHIIMIQSLHINFFKRVKTLILVMKSYTFEHQW